MVDGRATYANPWRKSQRRQQGGGQVLTVSIKTTGLAAASACAIGAFALATFALAGAARADDKPSVVFNAGVQSDYVFRGVSQTDGHASVFAGADLTYGQFYAGTWTSNLDFKPFGDTQTNEEIDLYAGWKPTVATVNLDLGVQYYGYVHQPQGAKVDFTEVYAKGSKAFGPLTLGAAVNYSPRFTYDTGKAWYYEANAAYAVSKKWTVSGAVAHQDIEVGGSYTTWNAGVTYAITDKVSLDGRYWDTDEHGFGTPYRSRAVLALKATF
jgi:uncharacterized protein (TIGR02001 family)